MTVQVETVICTQVLTPTSEWSPGVRADGELPIRSADSHRTCGNGSLKHGSLSGIALLPADAVGQHLGCDEDRSLCQDREVQRIAGPGINQPTPCGPSTSTVAA
jgi:hypothetical protein